MPIYTKTGDKGETSLFGGKRVSKTDPHIEVSGTIDELTSFMGLLISKVTDQKDRELFIEIQSNLHKIMGVVAGMDLDISALGATITRFEKTIDEVDVSLPKITRFILPGGTELSAIAHIVRTLCRKAERTVIGFYQQVDEKDRSIKNQDLVIQYLNRLSDLLFIFARKYGVGHEIST